MVLRRVWGGGHEHTNAHRILHAGQLLVIHPEGRTVAIPRGNRGKEELRGEKRVSIAENPAARSSTQAGAKYRPGCRSARNS